MDYEQELVGPPEGYTADEDVFSSAIEHHWDEILDVVAETRGAEWLANNAICLELLSTVSQRDFVHLRGGLKKYLRKGLSNGDQLTDEQLFAIAADVAAFIERLPNGSLYKVKNLSNELEIRYEPTPSRSIPVVGAKCTLEDDLGWAKELLQIARTFKDILSALSEPDLDEPSLRIRVRTGLQSLNFFLTRAPARLLVSKRLPGKPISFGRCPDPEAVDLQAHLAEWISNYLENYYPTVGIGVCAECGKFFGRERRDKTFCSKTCQNRVAYKRKKILDSGALEPLSISPDEAADIVAGLWIHHPRFGIGLVQGVSANRRPFANALAVNLQKVDWRYKSLTNRSVIIQVQFMHGVRMLGFTDLFEAQKKEEQLPNFYQVKSEETLAELL